MTRLSARTTRIGTGGVVGKSVLLKGFELGRRLGWRWLLFRVGYQLRLYSGYFVRRRPQRDWEAYELARWLRSDVPSDPSRYSAWRRNHRGKMFFDPRALKKRHFFDTSEVVAEIDEALVGSWTFFSGSAFQMGFPPDWHLDPLTKARSAIGIHWSRMDELGLGTDIKLIWELSRFSISFKLVRAYLQTRRDDYAEVFWRLIRDWRENNPPNHSIHWKCGQEVSFRLMAWCFALYGLEGSNHTTPARIAMLSAMIATHADRIEQNIDYARSQLNNHAISEAVGLWTVGLLFPEFQDSPRWREMGRTILEEEHRRQIYADGSYVQHSTNYHRLMLQDYLWAIRLGEVNQISLSNTLRDACSRAASFLYQLQEAENGQVPNLGANDGALILPLNSCDYGDFRPVLNACHYLFQQERLYPPGAWDEVLLWLFGPEALKAPVQRQPRLELSASVGGYYTLRSQRSWVAIRGATYGDRPSHADQLHLDLWWNGLNLACDAGSYLYNGSPPWDNGLARTCVHNTVSVDGLDQMERVGPFLWLNWSEAKQKTRLCSSDGLIQYWEGSHDGYERLRAPVQQVRAVIRIEPLHWLVLDRLTGDSRHDYRLHWLVPNLDYSWSARSRRLSLRTPKGNYHVQLGCDSKTRKTELVRCHSESTRGWRSQFYGFLEPAISLTMGAQTSGVLFWTLFSEHPAEVRYHPEDKTLRLPRVTIWLADGWTDSLVKMVEPRRGTALMLQQDVQHSDSNPF